MKLHEYRRHEDNRRKGSYDIVPNLPGDMNFTVHPKGVIPEELHLHKKQTDYFTVAQGKVMFLLVDKKGKAEKFILSSADHKTLIISPGTWHGYTALEDNTIMVFYISHKFDTSDEFRRKCDPSDWDAPGN